MIRKKGGPYTGRFDLPGGSLEQSESLSAALIRELQEETGLHVAVAHGIGTFDCFVAWTRPGNPHTHCHHIAALYSIVVTGGDIERSPNIDDSDGALWLDLDDIALDNCSPLVYHAAGWLRTGKLPIEAPIYDDWIVKSVREAH